MNCSKTPNFMANTVDRTMRYLRKYTSQIRADVQYTPNCITWRLKLIQKWNVICLEPREFNFVTFLWRLHNCTSRECNWEFFVQPKHMCCTSSFTPTCRTVTTGGGGGSRSVKGTSSLHTQIDSSQINLSLQKKHRSYRQKITQFIEMPPPIYRGLRVTTHERVELYFHFPVHLHYVVPSTGTTGDLSMCLVEQATENVEAQLQVLM